MKLLLAVLLERLSALSRASAEMYGQTPLPETEELAQCYAWASEQAETLRVRRSRSISSSSNSAKSWVCPAERELQRFREVAGRFESERRRRFFQSPQPAGQFLADPARSSPACASSPR